MIVKGEVYDNSIVSYCIIYAKTQFVLFLQKHLDKIVERNVHIWIFFDIRLYIWFVSIEVDCHFIRDLVIKKHIVTPYVRSEDQLSDILTKSLARSLFSILYSKLGMFNFYAPVWGGMLELLVLMWVQSNNFECIYHYKLI